jgi:hypothetical protein
MSSVKYSFSSLNAVLTALELVIYTVLLSRVNRFTNSGIEIRVYTVLQGIVISYQPRPSVSSHQHYGIQTSEFKIII